MTDSVTVNEVDKFSGRVDGPVMGTTGVSLTEDVVLRLDRLRAVFQRSRSWVIEYALLNGGIAALEDGAGALIARFNALAVREGQTWQDYAYAYAATNARRAKGKSIAELEAEAGITR